jgi:myo-inositol-1(or 4)-monophosphatase
MKNPIDLPLLRSWLKEAGRFALQNRRSLSIHLKADDSLVTQVDFQVEAYLLESIRQAYPGHDILTEESGIHENPRSGAEQGSQVSEWTWVIDPIDGTRAYATGLPIWGVSIGLLHQAAPYAGGFYMPVTREMVFGADRRAWHNGRRLAPLVPPNLDSPIAFIAAPSDFHTYFTLDFPRLRSFGSTAAHLSYVARGIALAALTRQVSLWDLAGLLPVFQAVGVELAYLSGRPFRIEEVLDGKKLPEALVAAQPGVIDAVRKMIHPL